ncbi:glycosyltransferase [Microlunatus elymi]|uniref:Glycosyltransferase n=1 Tax=Microlunatus elymi TaxID=2596828 RepID=A0A516PVG3_9ACTN|nr:glycosyltransferase [Microlunatus elymi]QDP95176.1 glycosyltransferase [Microlunatus elymi]
MPALRRRHPRSGPILIANPGSDLYGSDRVMLETVSALVGRGLSVVVTMPNYGPLAAEVERRGATTMITATPIIRKSSLRPAGMARLLRDTAYGIPAAISLIRRLRPRAVVVNTVTAPIWFPVARLLGVPTIGHVHEGEASVSSLLRRALALPLIFTDRLIVNSRFSHQVMTDALPPLDRRSTIVYNAVPGPENPTPPRKTLDPPIRLVFVGRLSARKGPHVAVEAVRLLAEQGLDVRLDLVGAVFPGYEWFEEELRTAVRRADLQDRVIFHGFQSDVWPYSADGDICVIPSTLDEPFGNTAVEAALAARPSIVSNTSGLIEASAGIGSAVRVPAGHAEAIADAVRTIADDWDSYRTRAVADAAYARVRYSAQRYGDEITKIITDAVDGKTGKRTLRHRPVGGTTGPARAQGS